MRFILWDTSSRYREGYTTESPCKIFGKQVTGDIGDNINFGVECSIKTPTYLRILSSICESQSFICGAVN